MISKQTIEKVLDACNIVEVVGEYVTLKRRGVRLQACCPFHQERTPSFTVFPESGTFHCFGCQEHGNSIGFLMKHEGMTYPEAVKALAQKYNIEVSESVPSAQEQEEYKRKEAMWIANENLAKRYHEELLKNEAARTYAFNRWGEEYCKQIGVGYCPPDARIVAQVGISEEIAADLHLKNKGGYDFFCGRITIPIVDRSHHYIGFTARAFDTDSKAKYMNSMDSLVYNKSQSLFGMETAWRVATRTETFYLVEGAPDCMRLQSIGIYNAVAPLGKAWTEQHFKEMRRAASHLCFLPDADPPKASELYGPGIQAVMKMGEEAMRQGFSVSVKPIPVPKGSKEKQDPDTYFTSKEIFEDTKEVDFVLWLADRLFEKDMNLVQKGKAVAHLASLIILIDDDTTVDMYVKQLAKYAGNMATLKKAIEKQRTEAERDEAKARADEESELYRRYGFNVEHNRYYSITENGGMYEWSNFIMQPLFHIKDAINSKRIYRLTNEDGIQDLVEMKQEDLVSITKFKQKVEGLGNYIWRASERELTKLKAYLYAKTETAVLITQLGWQRQRFYAFGNGVFDGSKFISVDDYGIVRLGEVGNFYLPANSKIYRDDIKLFQFERRFVHLGGSGFSMREFSDQIFKVFGDNGRVGFVFLIATLFRDIVTRTTRSFPILNLFGPKGSGKSELGHTLMSFFIIENVPPNIQNSTLPALNDTVAAVANALVHIDEYKNNLDINKHEFLKGLWDGTGRTRMNMDLDKKKETTSVDAGVIISGQEMPTADIALFSRLIFLTFPSSTFTDEQKKEYQTLKRMRVQGMSHLTLEILRHRKMIDAAFAEMYNRTMDEVNEALKKLVIEDRIMLNWVAPLAAFRCLETVLDTSLSYGNVFHLFVEGIKTQNAECRQNNELAAFWNMVQYLASEGEILEGGDFRIEYIRRLKTDIVSVDWRETRPVLYIQKTRLFMLYKKHGKAVGDTLLPEGSLKYYLENSREYLGEKTGIRYKVYHRGIIQMVKVGEQQKEQQTVQRSYCFDYNMLATNYNINLEKAPDTAQDTAHQEDFDAEHPEQPNLFK